MHGFNSRSCRYPQRGWLETLLVSVMLMWVIAPLMATLLVFQRRELQAALRPQENLYVANLK